MAKTSTAKISHDRGVPGSPYRKGQPDPDLEPTTSTRVTKKQRIVELYSNGITDIEQLADVIQCRPSYVASVLQRAGLIEGYFDLYTHTSQPMNVYSQFFEGKLGFKDMNAARSSVDVMDKAYIMYQMRRDRAGQHHVLATALTLFDRARWSKKPGQAILFRDWLITKLYENHLPHRMT
jgi:hypothetical protein